MGLFFDSEKEKLARKVPVKTHGFSASVGLLVHGLLADLIRFIIEPLFKWLFDFKNGTETTNKVRGITLVVIAVAGMFLIYTIPAVRDSTLSANTTINLTKDGRSVPIPLPENFREREVRDKLQFVEVPSVTYVTYNEAFAKIAVLHKGQCQMVTRGKSMTLSSYEEPFFAIGTETTITYRIEEMFTAAPLQERLLEYLFHYNYLWKSTAELSTKKISYSKKNYWHLLSEDWLSVRKDGIGLRSFDIQARSNENGMVCF